MCDRTSELLKWLDEDEANSERAVKKQERDVATLRQPLRIVEAEHATRLSVMGDWCDAFLTIAVEYGQWKGVSLHQQEQIKVSNRQVISNDLVKELHEANVSLRDQLKQILAFVALRTT